MKTGLTYNEVNILVYYLLIPLSWAVMLDFRLRLPIMTTAVFIMETSFYYPGLFIRLLRKSHLLFLMLGYM